MTGDYTESADQVLNAVNAAGIALSRNQLSEIHRYDLIERPVQLARCDRPGTESFYPTGSSKNLIQLLRYRTSERMAYRDWAWDAVRSGHPMPSRFWSEGAKKGSNLIERIGHLLNVRRHTDELGASIPERGIKRIQAIAQTRLKSCVAAAMRRRSGKKHFSQVLVSVLNVAFGGYRIPLPIAEKDSAEESAATHKLGRALGLTPPAKKKLPGEAIAVYWNVIVEEVETMFGRMSGLCADGEKGTQRIGPKQTERAALELIALFRHAHHLAEQMRQESKKVPPALALASVIFENLTFDQFLCMLVFWRGVRRIPSIAEGARNFLLLPV